MVENVNTPSSARIGRRGLNRRELLGADLAGATIVGFPYVSLARPTESQILAVLRAWRRGSVTRQLV